jgi:hypothetical protein
VKDYGFERSKFLCVFLARYIVPKIFHNQPHRNVGVGTYLAINYSDWRCILGMYRAQRPQIVKIEDKLDKTSSFMSSACRLFWSNDKGDGFALSLCKKPAIRSSFISELA